MKNTFLLFLRLALGASFLSAVADRLGFWQQNVAWGNWEAFVEYTGVLIPFLSDSLLSFAAFTATALEVILGIGLIIGFKTKIMALASGALLLSFGLSMALTLGIKAPFDYSVFTAAAAAFVLAYSGSGYLAIDRLKTKKQKRIFH